MIFQKVNIASVEVAHLFGNYFNEEERLRILN